MKAFTALAVFAALVLGSIAPWSNAQGISAATAINPRGWPPRPSDQFQWLHGFSEPVAGGQELIVVTVPADSYLVLNGGRWTTNGVFDLLERTGAGDIQKIDGILSGPIQSSSSVYGPMGIVFSPGSQVIVHNTNTGPYDFHSTNLLGYFVRD